jgi:hypothetical protein
VRGSPRSEDGPTLAAFAAPPNAELEIVLEREDIRRFKFLANILELTVRIRNLTDRPKALNEWGWTTEDDEVVEDVDAPPYRDVDAMSEAHLAAQLQSAVPAKVDAFETVSARIATAMPHQMPDCIDAYNVHITDDLGGTYILLMPRRGESKVWPS